VMLRDQTTRDLNATISHHIPISVPLSILLTACLPQSFWTDPASPCLASPCHVSPRMRVRAVSGCAHDRGRSSCVPRLGGLGARARRRVGGPAGASGAGAGAPPQRRQWLKPAGSRLTADSDPRQAERIAPQGTLIVHMALG